MNHFYFFIKPVASHIIFLSLLLFHSQVFAQKNIRGYRDSIFNKYADTTKRYNAMRHYYIAQWNDTVPERINVIRKIGERTAIINVNSKDEFDYFSGKIKISSASNSWKLSSAIERKLAKKNDDGFYKLILTGLFVDSILSRLAVYSKELIIVNINLPSQSVVVQTKLKLVKKYLISLKEIIFIDEYIDPKTEVGIIGYNRSFHGINVLDYEIPGANGRNIVVGIKEQKMDENDLDIYKRVLPSAIAATTSNMHATVMASIIGGAGNSFYDGRGVANAAKFFSSSFANLFADDTAKLNSNNVTVQNHSYGTIVQQFYGAEAVSYDVHTWQNKNFVHVFSAGNKGSSVATEGMYANIPNYANLTGNFKMAKNIITVGAIESSGNIAAESSAGPLYDGRLAPQLTALGPNGTSDAAAVVSGSVAVLQQVFGDSNNNGLPPASLIKAILFNTANDIYHTGIDYKTGYGLLNSYEAVKTIQQKKYDSGTLAQDKTWVKDIKVPANAAQLKITLAWTDSVATVNNDKALINDLDLQVKDINSGKVYQPWVLSTAPNIDSLEKPAIRKRDSLNTAEQVSVQLPSAGIYQVKVIGTAISSSATPFNIAYNIDTLNTFTFSNPLHASDVNRAENPDLIIKWKTFVADTNETGDLYISYNRGSDWQLLQQSIKIYTDQYKWNIKDTSTTALLKMETSFGTFLSKEFIISKVIRPGVDFLCSDSFQLSWDRHVYANAYKIYTLTDSPYLKLVITVTDTFKVFKRSDYPSLIYAVEPLLTNNLPAARSAALNITLQGVHCFYKTLNYNLLDSNNVKLILEISAASFADSIYFEKVSGSGELQQSYGAAKVTGNTVIYNQFVSDLASGITYFRGRIKLKSGGIVYTDIISVLTSGQQPIVFYPNPITGNYLNYVLKQDIFSDSRLQLFDLTGRLIKDFSSLPDKIDVSGFSAGVYIFKLISTSNKILTTGKIIVIR